MLNIAKDNKTNQFESVNVPIALTLLKNVPANISVPAACVVNPQNDNEILFFDVTSNDVTVYHIDKNTYSGSVHKGSHKKLKHRQINDEFGTAFHIMNTNDTIGYINLRNSNETSSGGYSLEYMVYNLNKKMWIVRQNLLSNNGFLLTNGYAVPYQEFLFVYGYFKADRILMFRIDSNNNYQLIKIANISLWDQGIHTKSNCKYSSLYGEGIIIVPQSSNFVKQCSANYGSKTIINTDESNYLYLLAINSNALMHGSWQLLKINLSQDFSCASNKWYTWQTIQTQNGQHLFNDEELELQKNENLQFVHLQSCLIKDRYIVCSSTFVNKTHVPFNFAGTWYFDLKLCKWSRIRDTSLPLYLVGWYAASVGMTTISNRLYVNSHRFRMKNRHVNSCDHFICLHFLSWKIERIVWIAYYKETTSHIYRLPKDVVKHIISWIDLFPQN